MINSFKSAEKKFRKTSAAVWFNKICRVNKLTVQHYFKIKGNNHQSKKKNTKLEAITYRLNHEIKFMYRIETALND
jgi:hypothetical protein